MSEMTFRPNYDEDELLQAQQEQADFGVRHEQEFDYHLYKANMRLLNGYVDHLHTDPVTDEEKGYNLAVRDAVIATFKGDHDTFGGIITQLETAHPTYRTVLPVEPGSTSEHDFVVIDGVDEDKWDAFENPKGLEKPKAINALPELQANDGQIIIHETSSDGEATARPEAQSRTSRIARRIGQLSVVKKFRAARAERKEVASEDYWIKAAEADAVAPAQPSPPSDFEVGMDVLARNRAADNVDEILPRRKTAQADEATFSWDEWHGTDEHFAINRTEAPEDEARIAAKAREVRMQLEAAQSPMDVLEEVYGADRNFGSPAHKDYVDGKIARARALYGKNHTSVGIHLPQDTLRREDISDVMPYTDQETAYDAYVASDQRWSERLTARGAVAEGQFDPDVRRLHQQMRDEVAVENEVPDISEASKGEELFADDEIFEKNVRKAERARKTGKIAVFATAALLTVGAGISLFGGDKVDRVAGTPAKVMAESYMGEAPGMPETTITLQMSTSTSEVEAKGGPEVNSEAERIVATPEFKRMDAWFNAQRQAEPVIDGHDWRVAGEYVAHNAILTDRFARGLDYIRAMEEEANKKAA